MYVLKSVFGSNIVLSTLIFSPKYNPHCYIYILIILAETNQKHVGLTDFKSILGRKAGRANFIVFPISRAETG